MKPDLDAIRARCEAATPGPWRVDGSTYDEDCNEHLAPYGLEGPNERLIWSSGGGEYTHPDMDTAQFIAAARTDVPALLAEVERLTRELQVERCGVRPIDELLQRVTTDRDELHVAWKREREEVERLTRERDEARTEVATLTTALDERDREAERVREQYDALAAERDEARAIANAAVRELNDANARAAMTDQLSGKPGGSEP